MSRYKLVTEKGTILTFSSLTNLPNGDVFAADVQMEAVTATPESHIPVYEPEEVVRRKPFKPKVEPRIGIMCPHCHQSRIGLYDVGKSDDSYFNMALIFSMNNKSLYWMSAEQILSAIESGVPVRVEDIDMVWVPDLTWKESLIGLLKNTDKLLMGVGDGIETTLHDIASEWPADKRVKCPMCGEVHTIQEWINEYANPSGGCFDPCKICGGETTITCADGFKGDIFEQPMKCEVCGFESVRDLKAES